MGRKAVVTQKLVYEAADTLAAQGKHVTAPALLKKLRGGSYTTIYRHMKSWQESRPARLKPAANTGLPEPVLAAFMAAWRLAGTEAARDFSQVRAQADEHLKTLDQQLQDSLAQIEQLEKDNQANAKQVEAQKLRMQELEEQLHKSEQGRAVLTATDAHQNHQLETVTAQLDRVQQDFAQERKCHEEQIQHQQEESASLIASLRAQLSEAQKHTELTERQLLELQMALEHTTKQLSQNAESLHAAEHARNLANEQRDATLTEAAELTGRVQALTAQNAELMKTLTTLAAQPAATEKKADIAEKDRVVVLMLTVGLKDKTRGRGVELKRAVSDIEKQVLPNAKKLSERHKFPEFFGQYEFVLSVPESGQSAFFESLTKQCQALAEKQKCFTKLELKADNAQK